jgi:hypothetical protein
MVILPQKDGKLYERITMYIGIVWDFGRPSISGSIPSIKMYSWA